jgi:hypothetical protein
MANLGLGVGESYTYSFVDFPTRKAWGVIIGALFAAGVLYWLGGKSVGDYMVKVADLLMQGAIITVLFTLLAKGLGVRLTRGG